ncbi:non-heme iron oxygenase ferredoxin subunit [soil metagenome]
MSEWHDAGPLEDLPDSAGWPAVLGNVPVALFRQGDTAFALIDLCSHGHARLSDGWVEDGCVECPLHQGRFDLATGAPICKPVTEPVTSFPVRVVAGRVEVHI